MNKYLARFGLAGVIILTGGCHATTSTGPLENSITEIPLPGAVKWDYLTYQPSTHHLFITHGDSVDVFDVTTNTVTAEIGTLQGTHGVALAPELNKGYVTEGKANRVTVFDLKNFKSLHTVATGAKPDAIVYDETSSKVYVADGEANALTVINAKKDNVIRTIKLDGAPEFEVLDGKGKLFVNLEDKSAIDVVDLVSLKVVNRFNLAPACNAPSGLAMDKDSNTLFSVCRNKIMAIVDAVTGRIKDKPTIGEYPDAAVFDPRTGRAYSSNGNDGTLTVIGKADDGHYETLRTIPTKISARTMALNPETDEIYLSAAQAEGFDPVADNPTERRPHMKPGTFVVVKVSASTSKNQ